MCEPVTKRSKTAEEEFIKMCHVAVAGCSHGELGGSIIHNYGRFGFSWYSYPVFASDEKSSSGGEILEM